MNEAIVFVQYNFQIYDVLKHLQAYVDVGQCSLSTVTMHWYRLDKRKRRRRNICVGVLKETKKEKKKETKKERNQETNKLGEI